jgi:hypothetical protein
MLDPPQSLHVQGSITLFPVDQMTLPVLITLALLLFVILAECPYRAGSLGHCSLPLP